MIGERKYLVNAGQLLRTLDYFNYSIMNDQPTRVTTSSSTLIDHVISSKPETIKATKSLELGTSDHMLIYYVSLKTNLKRPPPKIINAQTYSKFNLEQFRKDIEEAPWLRAQYMIMWTMSTGCGVTFSTISVRHMHLIDR